MIDSPEVDRIEIDDVESVLSAAEHAGMNTREDEQYHLHTGIDEEFFYIIVDVRSRTLQRQIEDFGFTVNIEAGENWLGLSYPMGMIEALRDVPGAATSYILDPSWQDMQQNESTISQAEEDQQNRAMLSQSEDDSPASISITELRAQRVLAEIQDESGFYAIAYRIPLQSGRNQQFAVNAQPGESISVEIAVNPPDAETLTGEDLTGAASGGMDSDMMGVGQGQQGQQGQEQEEMSEADRVDQALGRGYSNSFQIMLSDGQNEN